MNMLKLIKSVAICLMLVLSFSSKSQISYDNVVKGLHSYVSNDSLKGFNEQFYKQDALQRGFFGMEYNVYMYIAKRSYINTKYNLNTNQNPYGSNLKPGPVQVNAAPCVNEDFEAGTFAGWTVSQGQNVNVGGSCTMAGCCPTISTNTWIRTTPYAGPLPLGVVPASPFGGTQVAQLNDMVWNQGEIVRIQQTFPVTITNALFQFAYLAAMDGSGHACCDQPFMKITVLNCANQPLACPSVSITPPGSSCVSSVPSGWVTNTSGVSYTTSWQIQSLDLTPYIGSCVTIQVTVGDCTGWAHAGMAYFDAVCKPITLQVNNNFFPAGTNAFVVSSCGTNTAVMTAPAGLGPYLWNGPGGSGITNNPNQTITTSTPGTYTLVMNPPGSCSPIIKTVTLTIGTSPNSGFTSVNACNNYTFTNTGSASPAVQTYSFIGTGAPSSYTTTNTTSNVTFSVPGTYTVQQVVTNTVGCTSTSTQVVSVISGPTLVVNSPSICPGGTANLNVSGATTYIWSGPGLSNPNISNPTANPTATTIYTVSGTAVGCTSTTTLVVTTLPAPTISATGGTMCVGSSVNISSSGALSYTWSPSSGLNNVNNSNPNASPVSNTTYTVSGSGSNGCVGTQTAIVLVNPLPILSTTSSTICSNGAGTISVSGANTYTWSNGSNSSSVIDNPSSTTLYTVTGTSINGCVSSSMASITIAPPFAISISNNSPICQGYTINLLAPLGYQYNWIGPNGFISNLSNPVVVNAQPQSSGQYTLNATDVNGCVGIATTNVVVNTNPVLNIVSASGSCAPSCVTFTCTSTNSVSNISWFFQNGGSSSDLTTTQCFSKGGFYTSTATVIDNNGCVGLSTHTIEIYPSPTADFVFAPIRPIEGSEVSFTDASFGANITQWYWFFSSQVVNSTLQNPIYSYVETGTYPVTLIVKSDKGCMDTLTQIIVIGEDYGIYVPNTFTPNGDGFNDTFFAKGFGIVKYEMNIFDRWGERIFTTNDMHNAWDGKYRGVLCKEDAYTWKINLVNVFSKSHELTGHVTLIK